MVIQYPRVCSECGTSYTQKSNYFRHFTNGVCERKQNAVSLIQKKVVQNVTNNNIQNNNQIQININVQNNYSNAYKDPLHTRKEQKQIFDVLNLLKDKGYVTEHDVQRFIMNEFVTLQEFVESINNYSIDVLRNIASDVRRNDTKNDLDKQLKTCVGKLFHRLILNTSDEPYITPETLKSNPLYKSTSGQLSAWSAKDCDECPNGYAVFGVPVTPMKKWIAMQDEGTWKTLIDVIGNRYIIALQAQKDMSSYLRDSNDQANVELAEYWESSMTDIRYADIVKELSSDLSAMCRRDVNSGWYSLTKLASERKDPLMCLE